MAEYVVLIFCQLQCIIFMLGIIGCEFRAFFSIFINDFCYRLFFFIYFLYFPFSVFQQQLAEASHSYDKDYFV